MPFVAEHDDELVIPEAVSDGTDLSCPECGEEMRPRGPFTDGTARHFYHLNASGCSGGESDTHRKWKSLAVSALRQHFDDKSTACGPEVLIETEKTLTTTFERRADALVSFEEPNQFFGEGVIVEVQYQNEGKDVAAATHDYLARGYSVYWAGQSDFEDDRFLIENMLAAFNDRCDSAYAPYYADPLTGLTAAQCRADGMLEYILTERSDHRVSYSDPFPDRDHDWYKHMREVCYRCRVERLYSAVIDEVVYFYKKDAKPREVERIERGDPPEDHSHEWRAVRGGPEGEQLDCDCGAKRTHTDGTVTVDHGPGATWDITVPIVDQGQSREDTLFK